MNFERKQILGAIAVLVSLACSGISAITLLVNALLADPLYTLRPFGFSIISASAAYFGIRCIRHKSWQLRWVLGLVAGIPALLMLVISCSQAAVAFGVPGFSIRRERIVDVAWEVQPNMPNRVSIEIWGTPKFFSLEEQDGLIEHLRSSGSSRAKLKVADIIGWNGDSERFQALELNGIRLKRQYHADVALPKDAPRSVSESSNHSDERPAAH